MTNTTWNIFRAEVAVSDAFAELEEERRPEYPLGPNGCTHNEMELNDEPGFTWKCANRRCGYVFGK